MRRAIFISLVAALFVFVGALGFHVFPQPNQESDRSRSQTILAGDASILRAFLSLENLYNSNQLGGVGVIKVEISK